VIWRDELKRRSDAALLNVLHPGTVPDPDNDLTPSGSPDFGGGVRELPEQPPRLEWTRDPGNAAWQTVELEDGASLLFPHLRG